MTKGKGGKNNGYRGSHKNQQFPREEQYEEMFPSYENTRRKNENSHSQLGHFMQNGSYEGRDSRNGNQYGSRGSRNGNQRGSGGRGYNSNDYQGRVNEEYSNSRSQNHHSGVQQRSPQTEDVKASGNNRRDDSPTKEKLSVLKCPVCFDYYNAPSRIPRSLWCGHSICTSCLDVLLRSNPKCPQCREPFKKELKNAEDAVINYVVRDLVQSRFYNGPYVEDDKASAAKDTSCRPKSESSKSIVTIGADKSYESKASYANSDFKECSPVPPEKSPHNSRCLEIGVNPTSHCAKCQKWVCDKCGKIDHCHARGCFLIAKKEALIQMRDAQVTGANACGETAENTLRELQMYEEQLDAFSMTMQAAFESIAQEKERIKMIKEEGKNKQKELKNVLSAMENDKNLPEALDSLQQIEMICKGTKYWTTSTTSKTLDYNRVRKITKEILLSTLQMKTFAESENRTVVLMAYHIVSNMHLYSHMTVEGGRINVHTLEKVDTVPKGSRVVPLASIKSCLDPESTLTFLDIGWNGNKKGRVHIRLLGDTLRGRQFLMLCTGEAGPSFRNTSFHRVWWKDLPGEHIWGGDYDQGDGSGGTTILQVSDKEKSSLYSGRSLPIRAGLVAGRYENSNLSSIFRIYTKDSKGVKDESRKFAKDPIEVKDDAAFGIVEFGLDILESAINHRNVKDVTIYACGVVIET